MKFWIFLGGSLNAIIGIIIIILGIILQGIDSNIIPPDMESSFSLITWIVIATGAIIFLSGVLGIVGGVKKIKCFLFLFIIITFLFFLISLGLAIASSVGQSALKDEIGTSESCITFFSSVDTDLEEAFKYFCTSACICYMTDEVYDDYGSKSLTEQSKIMRTTDSSSSSLINIVACETVINNYLDGENQSIIDFNEIKNYQNFLKSVEEYFECSGLCTPQSLYGFSDVNNGPPEDFPGNEGCYVSIYEELSSYLKSVIIPLWIVAGVFLITVIFSYILMCSPKHKQYLNDKYEDSTHERSSYYN